jgi:hypothetical protein
MNPRLDKNNVLRTAKRILGFAGLAWLASVCVRSAWAQSQPNQSESSAPRAVPVGPATSPGVQPASATRAAKQGVEQDSAAKPSGPKGEHEGVTVHGHWTIEVKNPDGKLVTHREFENALSPGFANPFGGGSLPGGASLLSALITGQTMVMPAAWGILLEGPNYPSNQNAPCANGQNNNGYCVLMQDVQSPLITFCTNSPAGFSCNLAVSPIGTAPSFTGFQIQGTVLATQKGSVSAVATIDINACGLGGVNGLANCVFTSTQGFVAFTAAKLDGNTVSGDPLPVPVTAGQTIAVTVTISFQ